MRTLVVNALRLIGKRTAMGRYIEYLSSHWSRSDIPFDRVVLLSPANVSLPLAADSNVALQVVAKRCPLFIWEQLVLPRAAEGAAILFCPSYICPLFYGGPVVVANHGIYEALPDEFPWWRRLRTTPIHRSSARRAQRVIANSHTTKADLVKYFKTAESKIDVVYPAAAEIFFEFHDSSSVKQEVLKTLGRKAPYILFVGKLSKRRNIPALLEAFSVIRKSEHLPHHLLIVGPNTTHIPLERLAARHGISEFVKYHWHLEQRQLARLYAGADLYVLPSAYEGASWTMLEAMASGSAVLTVDHPTLSELGRNTVFLVPTASVQDLVNGLRCILKDPSLRETYARTGHEWVQQLSWKTVAEKTMAILDREANPSDWVS